MQEMISMMNNVKDAVCPVLFTGYNCLVNLYIWFGFWPVRIVW